MAKGKYEEWLEPDNLLRLEGWARDGLTEEQIAYNMGIAYKTLWEWKGKYSDICNALKRSKEIVDREVENALYKNAMGFEYIEVKEIMEKDEKGKDVKRIEKIKKYMPPNTTAQIFWLKNRKTMEWRDKQDVELNANVQTKIIIDGAEIDTGN